MRTAVAAVALSVGLISPMGAHAQYPAKAITTVVGFEPGGGTDTVARIVAKTLSEQVGQQVVVENRAGAGGDIAVDYVAKSAPDGYTLVLANVGALTVNPHMLKVPYDPMKDLTPITMGVVFSNVLIVQPSLPVKNLADYVELARKKPGEITYASSGIGGAGHLAGELLKKVAKIDIVHVPYKGGGPAMTGFLGAQVTSFFATPVSSIGGIKGGKARAIAVTGSKRTKLLPDVPTVAESGYQGYEALNWYAYLGPANMPREVVERLNKELHKALTNREVLAAMDKQGVEPQPGTPDELARYMRREYDTWGKVVKEAGIKPQ
ncbi:MAG TPA: tripartite tricarboxylate transporter substrate binding protein [Burkholderiales bacterium]|nr:tripartite tricarboxylate transporter substrate binding protein [Burkholderiales bacterium]